LRAIVITIIGFIMVFRRSRLWFLIFAATAVYASDPAEAKWSVEATALPQFWNSDTKPVALAAPNGKLVLRVVGKKTGRRYPEDEVVPDYFLERDSHRLGPAIKLYNSPRALWSPNSDLLAVTSSKGGLVGNWTVSVYGVDANRVVEYNVMKQVQADLAHTFPGGVDSGAHLSFSQAEKERFARDTSWVNVFAVHWLSGPGRLLVLAGVPPSSGYGANMGKRKGYIVDPRSGEIQREYTEYEFRRAWPQYIERD